MELGKFGVYQLGGHAPDVFHITIFALKLANIKQIYTILEPSGTKFDGSGPFKMA